MKKVIYAALLVVSTLAFSSFTTKNDSAATKTADRKNLATADDRKNLATADDRKNLATADAKTSRHTNDRKNLATAD